jgi:hypothetical protein
MNIDPRRMTVDLDRAVVVFLVGMRVNRPWKVHKWWPVVRAMTRMIGELHRQPDSGFLAAESWFGRTTLMVQYWESFAALEAYAKARDGAHLPAWSAFQRALGSSGDVGIWHETYEVLPGHYECIYLNMPVFGLGRVGPRREASGTRAGARGRLRGG